jgi:toxin secretion/phage lysis holin
MKWILTGIKGATGVVVTFVSYLFGGFDVMFQVLMFCIIADYITGLMAAFYLGKLNSKVGFKGILKKVAILMVVALAVEIGRVTGMDAIRGLIMGFYIANEGISILENVGRMDVPYLSKLKDILEQLKDDKK